MGLDPRNPVQSVVRLISGLGPISTRKVAGERLVLVNGADLVAELNDETRFRKHTGLHILTLRRIVGDALFTAETHEPNWRLAHDILLPAFTREAMQTYHATMLAVARELLNRWDDAAASGRAVDVTSDMTRMTLETIGRAGFGYSFESFGDDDSHPFVTAMNRSLRYANFPPSPALAPVRRLVAGSTRRYQASVSLLERTVDDVIAARRRGVSPQTPDLLDRMLHTAHPATGEHLDPINIRRQIITFVVAGHETTSGLLSFALYYLSAHPYTMLKAQAEVDGLWAGATNPEPAFADIPKLRYVRAVVDETLRLWPTAPAYLRAARRKTTLGGRYTMNEGDWVVVLLPALHRDPEAWPNPERFDPDRFGPGRAKTRHPHAYKPFGTGERACIGRQFALHEAVLTLALLLHRYDLAQNQGYRLRVAESLTLKPAGFRLRPRRRRH